MGETIGVSATATITWIILRARRRVLPVPSAALPKGKKINSLSCLSCVDEIALRDRAFWIPAGSPPGRRGLYALSGPAARQLTAGPGSGTRRRTGVAAGSQAAWATNAAPGGL